MLKKILAVLGYVNLWMFVHGVYTKLQDTNTFTEVFSYVFIVGVSGIVLRWFSIDAEKREKVLTIIEDILFLMLIRGVFGIGVHFMLPAKLHRIVTDPLMYGSIFLVIGAVGLYFLKKIPIKKKVE